MQTLLVLLVVTYMSTAFPNNGLYNYQEENSICMQNGLEGRCVHIEKCPSAMQMLLQKEKPNVCTFRGILPVVCCTENKLIKLTKQPISDKICEEYSAIIGKIVFGKEIPPFGLIAGLTTLPKEFPHMALLGYGDENNIQWQCGGTLISKNFVLTAAHCLYSQSLGDIKFVRLGDLDISTNDDKTDPQQYKVTGTYQHPEYSPRLHYHDIGLLKLSDSVRFSTFVKTACLYTDKSLPKDQDLVATGWGQTAFGGPTSNILQKIYLNQTDYVTCSKIYTKNVKGLDRGLVDEWQMCAGIGPNGEDACQGDSGGPLQTKAIVQALHRVVGITSFGINCGLVPGVYTRVSHYVSWIENIVWPEELAKY